MEESRYNIKKTIQLNMLESLHEAHTGMSRIESLARLYLL